jgi:thymidylate synthase
LEKKMQRYLDLLTDILDNGEVRDDRTGVGTKSVFGRQLRFDLNKGFPAITTKKLAWRAVKGELLWFLEGSGDERRLAEITHGTADGKVTIWTPNAMAGYWQPHAKFPGDLGRVYGVQWRDWQTHQVRWTSSSESEPVSIDQIAVLIEGLKKDPYSRRHILSAWNVAELDQMALPPCHVLAQFYVSKDGRLSCHMYQRSVDVFLGLPFNIASYALLTHLLAHVCNLRVGELVISTGDTHIYLDHIEQVKEQLTRDPLSLPELFINPEVRDIDRFTMDDIQLVEYKSHGSIKAKMAV